jgi:DNA-binding transcriptional LysR family regulator
MPLDFHADRLRAFVAVAQERGFSRAARRLGQSQSSVSQAVAALERELDEQLFIRDGRRTHVTDAGGVLLEYAMRAFAELEAGRAALAALRDVTAGRLRLGTSDTLATYLLPPVFGALREHHPGIDLQLVNRTSPVIVTMVAEREVDVGVVSLPLPTGLRVNGRPLEQRVRLVPLLKQRDVLLCPPDHPLATNKSVSLRVVAEQALLLLDDTTATRAYLDARFEAANLRPRIVMEMSSVEVLKRLVELGFGVSIVPALAASREAERGTLVAIPIRELRKGRQIGLALPTTTPVSHTATRFVELAQQILTAGSG